MQIHKKIKLPWPLLPFQTPGPCPPLIPASISFCERQCLRQGSHTKSFFLKWLLVTVFIIATEKINIHGEQVSMKYSNINVLSYLFTRHILCVILHGFLVSTLPESLWPSLLDIPLIFCKFIHSFLTIRPIT